MYLALYARRAWVIFDHPYNAESARFVDCLEIGYPYAHISCSGARAVTGGEHGGRLTLGGSWLRKRTLWSPVPDPGRAGTTVACQRPRGG